jgi:hypothetical protein
MKRTRKYWLFTSGLSAVLILFGNVYSAANAANPRSKSIHVSTVDVLNLESPPMVIEVGGPGLGSYDTGTATTSTRKYNLRQGQSAYIDYSVEGPNRASLMVEMVDLGVDPAGNKIPFPLNSTKFGLAGTVQPELSSTTYIPNGTKQHYRVKITNLVGSLSGIRLGGVKVNLIPYVNPKSSQKIINQVNAIVVSVGAIQYGFDINKFNTQAKIVASNMRFVPIHRSGIMGIIDYIPDLPHLIDHGAADWSLDVVNRGVQPLQEFMRWRIVKGFQTPYTDDTTKYKYYYALEAGEHLTIPDQVIREKTKTTILRNTEVQSNLRKYAAQTEVNALPLFGFFTIDAQVHTSFGSFVGKTQHFAVTYLVVPWKEILILILIYLGFRKIRRKLSKRRFGASPEEQADESKPRKKLAIRGKRKAVVTPALKPELSSTPEIDAWLDDILKKSEEKARKASTKKSSAKKAPAKRAAAKKPPAKKPKSR